VGYNLAWILDSIARLYAFKADPLRVTGGGARGLPWLQIIADITGRKLETVPHLREAAAVGAGLVAAVGLGIYPSFEALKSLVPINQVIEPDDSHRDVYDRQSAAYRQVYPALRKLYHQMNEG
jgi:xylulokinase